MNQKDFHYVLMLSQKLNFTHAADALGITQPSLSQYIKKLERELGVDLFVRSGQEIRLTDAGQAYLEAGRRIMDIEHRLHADFLDLMACKTGSVVIGTSPYRSASMMPGVVAAFRAQYPGISVVIEEATTAELTEEAERGKYDLCIVMQPVDEQLFAYEKIRDEELILAVPAACPALEAQRMPGRKYPAIDARLLDGRDFVMVTEAQVMQRELNRLCAAQRLTLNRAVTVKSLEAQMAMVRAGAGMALLPVGIECFCQPGEVAFYSFRQALPHREVVALWPKDRPLTQVARSLLDCMQKMNG